MTDHTTIDITALNYYPRLAKVKRYVEAHFSEPLDLEQVARIAGLEKTYFSTYFHQKTGVCFHDWLNSIRVNEAVNLMSHHDLSITEVAMAVGFQELRTFERAVRKHTGYTPQAIKNKLRPGFRHH